MAITESEDVGSRAFGPVRDTIVDRGSWWRYVRSETSETIDIKLRSSSGPYSRD